MRSRVLTTLAEGKPEARAVIPESDPAVKAPQNCYEDHSLHERPSSAEELRLKLMMTIDGLDSSSVSRAESSFLSN
ncbi:hypothetical protein PGT21_035064 [Puccinia graminis f. sp. tritici]|uniref:Uncharacterized protein n=1 Tax=Puccinia graminis f. sp. tritici TaxID=56615 RepID=A0A5B0LPT4_PUCGR|nr:hypothetical protein PGT21_031788 [Puccinia graminis f. sp. tritici]KAA1081891.1 hypothetical protein PGTUg99_026801 [Puccinia graminis f. sp. tritici]KAA1087661.1 hypothetical protein PGT21_035064 [Puccinia graminis f. sp. tritici]